MSLGPARERIDRTRASALASVAALASGGEPVLVVCADALWRRGLVESAASPARFGGGGAAIVAARGSLVSGVAAAEMVLETGHGGIALADWAALALAPGLARRFPHVILADPAPDPRAEALALAGGGYAHALGSHQDPTLSVRSLALRFPDRVALGRVYTALQAHGAGGVGIPALRMALEAAGGDGQAPELCARAVRVLAEIGVVRTSGTGRARVLEVVSSVRGELERSPSYVANLKAHEECVRFLTRGKEQSSSPMPAAA